MVHVEVKAPPGWGPTRFLITQLRELGYEVVEWRTSGDAPGSVLEIR
jgi:hypothetical protein